MVLNREQLECLESPIKASVFAVLRALGPSSARELTLVTGGTTGALYHHLRQMIKVGLVRIAEVRPAETRPEAVYELSSKEFFIQGEVGDQEYRESTFRSAKNVLRLVQRNYEGALEHVVEQPEIESGMKFHFMAARLSPKNLAKLRAGIEELLLEALATHDSDGLPVIFSGLMAPIMPKRV